MEIVEDRYQNASIMINSQLPVAKWHDVIGEPTFAAPPSRESSHRTGKSFSAATGHTSGSRIFFATRKSIPLSLNGFSLFLYIWFLSLSSSIVITRPFLTN
jgi:hypothetical protein